MSGTEWLSEGAEKLFAELQDKNTKTPHYDIAIVGSGYGGAVAAARFAGLRENGRELRVCVLERGREFVPGTFPEKFSELPGQVRIQGDDLPSPRGVRDGLFDFRLGRDVSALLGNGLGGGSLINAGVLARPDIPDKDFFKKTPWPTALPDLDGYYRTASSMLRAEKIPEPKPAKLVSLDAVGRALGDRHADRRAEIAVTFSSGTNAAGIFQQPCLRCGDCFTGCNHWAKNTLAMNYLPWAVRRGAKLFTGVTVLTLAPVAGGKGWRLQLELTDADTDKRLRQSLNREEEILPKVVEIFMEARRVVLAAGTFGSTEILLRSKDESKFPLSKSLGKHFSTNGDMIAVGYKMRPRINASATQGTPPGKRDVGPTITGIVDLRDSRNPEHHGIVIEELAIPAALRRLFEETITTFGGVHALVGLERSRHTPDFFGADPAAIDQTAVAHTAVYATMGDDGAGGALELLKSDDAADGPLVSMKANDGDKQFERGIRVAWKDVAKHDVFHKAVRVLNEAHVANSVGGTVIPYPGWRPLPEQIEAVLGNPAGKGSVFTVHPLGGCAMANSGADGVVNHLGQVFIGETAVVHDNLVVLDGSIVPCSLGINPCLTIAALAEHAVEKLQEVWMLTSPEQPGLHSLPPPPDAVSRDYDPPRPTAIRLAERMKGELLASPGGWYRKRIAGADLEMEFEAIQDLGSLLANLPKIMPIAVGKLVVTAAGTGPDTPGRPAVVIPVTGHMSLLEREKSVAAWRATRAIWTWLWNRGWRDIWKALVYKGKAAAIWLRSERARRLMRHLARHRGRMTLQALLALASHVGEARRFVYWLMIEEELRIDGKLILRRGSHLVGEKRLAYTHRGNPWLQLTRLRLHHVCQATGEKTLLGKFDLDPRHFVKEHAVQLQLLAQDTQPDAIADLVSFATYLLRLVGTVHLLSLRAPDYPRPYPNYIFRAGETRHERRLPGAIRGEVVRENPIAINIPESVDMRFPRYSDGVEISPLTFPLDLGPSLPIYLTRYRPKEPSKLEPVLLIHGYGASGTTFVPPDLEENLVQHLVEKDFDCWVVDLRTSIGLNSSTRAWVFEQIAHGDIPFAVEHVQNVTGKKVNIVAHCVGAAMFSMAALGGRLTPGQINAVVLSQVGPLVDLPSLNATRGYFAAYLKYLLRWNNLNVTAPLSPLVRIIDRFLSVYPYPDHERSVHHSLRPCGTVTHEIYCNRTHSIFGRLFEHDHLNQETLNHLDRLLGHVNLKTFLQTTFYATKGRITDFLGRNAYVSYDSIAKYFCFPVCIIHGRLNEVFSPEGGARSMDLLKAVFGSDIKQLKFEPVKGYGHQDCLVGEKAHDEVYPAISGFLKDNAEAQKLTPLESARDVVREPRLGPVIGWLRWQRSCDSGPREYSANIMIVADDSRSPPLYALTIVVPSGDPLKQPVPFPGFAKFHELQTVPPKLAPYAARADRPATVAQNLCVELPPLVDDCLVLVLTVHREPDGVEEPGPRQARVVHYADKGTRLPGPKSIETGPLSPIQFALYVEPVLKACTELCRRATRFCREPRVIDDDYETMPGIAVISKECLAAAGPSSAARPESDPQPVGSHDLVFAMGSCRYSASIFDRELADRSFRRLMTVLEECPAGRFRPQFLLMAGDQIYADATAGLFDPTTGLERFDYRYIEAWGAPYAREVLRRLPAYMMLDDHEIEEDWEKSPSFERDGISAFVHYQRKLAPPNPNPGKKEHAPFWYSFSSHGYGFFVTDTRSERDRHEPPDRLDDAIFCDSQMDALINWLRQQNAGGRDFARPKFVVSPSVLVPWNKASRGSSAYALRVDGWDGFPASMNKLLAFVAEERIGNVIFLSGDYHCSMVCEIDLTVGDSKGQPVRAYSIVSSGFYAPYPFANTPPADLQLAFEGSQEDWIGKLDRKVDGWKDLRIKYCTHSLVAADCYAILRVGAPAGKEPRTLGIEFDSETGVTRTALRLG